MRDKARPDTCSSDHAGHLAPYLQPTLSDFASKKIHRLRKKVNIGMSPRNQRDMTAQPELSQRYFNDVYVPLNFGPQNPFQQFFRRFFRTTASSIAVHSIDLLREVHPTSILDLGCGTGAYLAELAAAYPLERAVGVDFSEAAIAMAETRLSNRNVFSFERAPVEHCQALDGTYDVVLAIGLFDYLRFDSMLFDAMLKAARTMAIVTLPRRRFRLQRLARHAWLRMNGVTLCTYMWPDIEKICQSAPEAKRFSMRISHPPDLPDNEWLVCRRLEPPA